MQLGCQHSYFYLSKGKEIKEYRKVHHHFDIHHRWGMVTSCWKSRKLLGFVVSCKREDCLFPVLKYVSAGHLFKCLLPVLFYIDNGINCLRQHIVIGQSQLLLLISCLHQRNCWRNSPHSGEYLAKQYFSLPLVLLPAVCLENSKSTCNAQL